MTTRGQLDKIRWFSDQMRRRGFAVENKFQFWRKRGPLYDIFGAQVLTGGALMRMYVSIWSPWIEHPQTGELGEFPPEYVVIGGEVSDRFPERLMSGYLFDIETEEDVERSLRELLHLIDTRCLAWFASVDSYDSYTAYLDMRSFKGTREYKEKVRAGLARAFEMEPFPGQAPVARMPR